MLLIVDRVIFLWDLEMPSLKRSQIFITGYRCFLFVDQGKSFSDKSAGSELTLEEWKASLA